MEDLRPYVRSFQKALRLEMDAMREQLGSFEVGLTRGRSLEVPADRPADSYRYAFALAASNDKLSAHMDCTLRLEKSEYLVKIVRNDALEIEIECADEIPLDGVGHALVIYPWFLYEKLLAALADLTTDDPVENALRLFGATPHQTLERQLQLPHRELNHSQRRAVELCCQTNPAFIWGPPGTGKTHTLGALLAELLQQGCRILVTSTTNAAVDQALAQIAERPEGQAQLDNHRVLRLGQTSAPSYGATLTEVVASRDHARLERLDALQARQEQLEKSSNAARRTLELLQSTLADAQLTLFSAPPPSPQLLPHLRSVFSPRRAKELATHPPDELLPKVATRLQRLERLSQLYRQRRQALHIAHKQSEQQAFASAKLVFATMANAYLHPLMQKARFDVVIAEEASMAVLPTLFYAASLARDQVIVVGDPKQLPPIVQSRDPYVHKAMGRSIFSLTADDPLKAANVAMLNTQYRMHPAIGDLVGELFYHGALHSATADQTHQELAQKAPFSDHPLVLVDTTGKTQCMQRGRHSRYNEQSALLCRSLVETAERDGVESIGVITPYVEQARHTRDLLREANLLLDGVECSTVHRFQGREKDLIILDLVDAAPMPPGRLLGAPSADSAAAQLLNVSLSRARGKLLIIADMGYFQQKLPRGPLRQFLERATRVATIASADDCS